MPEGPTAHGGGREGIERLRVTIVAAEAEQHRRLLALLEPIDEIHVVGIAEVPDPADVLGPGADIGMVVRPPRTLEGRPRLAPRQRDVLVAYAASNDLVDVVARRLGMNPETFKTHLRRIRAKYEEAGRSAPTRRDLYVRAIEDGLIPPPS